MTACRTLRENSLRRNVGTKFPGVLGATGRPWWQTEKGSPLRRDISPRANWYVNKTHDGRRKNIRGCTGTPLFVRMLVDIRFHPLSDIPQNSPGLNWVYKGGVTGAPGTLSSLIYAVGSRACAFLRFLLGFYRVIFFSPLFSSPSLLPLPRRNNGTE